MRSLIVRFADFEGPGIIEPILQEKGYAITYHDSYKKGIQLLKNSHLQFDLIVLMGGPQSVYDPSLQHYFNPFLDLVQDVVRTQNRKILGICLGSQIIAKALGSPIFAGKNGAELGFGKCKIEKPSHPIFTNLNVAELNVFHWHGDTYEIPNGAEWLLSSDQYSSQAFSYKNKAFGIQCHIEITESLLSVWKTKSSEIKKLLEIPSEELKSKITSVQQTGKQIIENIINI